MKRTLLNNKLNLKEWKIFVAFQAIEQVETWDRHTEMCLLAPAGVRVKDAPSTPPTRLRLATLTSTSEYVREEGLDSAVRLCPEVTAVSLTNAWLPNDSLYKVYISTLLNKLVFLFFLYMWFKKVVFIKPNFLTTIRLLRNVYHEDLTKLDCRITWTASEAYRKQWNVSKNFWCRGKFSNINHSNKTEICNL